MYHTHTHTHTHITVYRQSFVSLTEISDIPVS